MFGDKFPDYIKNLTELLLTRRPTVFLVSLIVTLGIVGVRQTRGLKVFELAAYDHLVRLSYPQKPDDRILIVGISESDIQKHQRWPLSDQIIAKLLQQLQQHQPKVIGLDVYRDLPQGDGHQKLIEQLQAKNIIVISKGDQIETDAIAAPPEVSPEQIGFSDLIVDIDNVIRRNLLYVESPFGQNKFYSLALRVSLKYLSDHNITFQATPNGLTLGSASLTPLTPNAGGYRLDASETTGWQILLRYRSPHAIARQVTLTEVLENKIDPSWLKGRVVLIGYTAPSVKDVFATPYSAMQETNYWMSGVEIHAQMVSQLLSIALDGQPQIRILPEWVEWLWIWFWALLGGLLIWRYNRPSYAITAIFFVIFSLWVICFILFSQSIWLSGIPATLSIVSTGAIILGRKAHYNLYHDSLTNLPNRRSFLKEIRLIKKINPYTSRHLVAILFLNLDRFKMINKGLSQQAGDFLLVETAKRLQKILKNHEKMARVGGDEFAIWLSNVQNIDEVTHLANLLQEQLRQPLKWDDQEIFSSVSIGIALERIDSLLGGEELLRHAHIAMYRAKDKGKDRYEMFSPVMKSQAETRWQLEANLRKAIQQQEFQLYYQPIISLITHKIVGFEALIRWPSSEKGFISPDQFIPIAEETGLIVPLGEWILKEACYQMKQWHEQFPRNPPLLMSVNLSSCQFNQPDLLVQQIQNILKEVVDEKQRNSLKLEITESIMFNNVEGAIQLLHRLKALGLRISIDDFGTGYSNLSYLHRFPIDTLKVDQSFVRRMHEEDNNKYAQIVQTVVTLGHNLGLEVVAEGIETEAQMKTLLAFNCEFGQGYFFAKPLPASEATAILQQDPQW